MANPAVVEKAGAAVSTEKEKMEKRRALGRGLESLLPRPRVVAGTAVEGSANTAATAELRSARTGEAPVPTQTNSTQALRSQAVPPIEIQAVVDGSESPSFVAPSAAATAITAHEPISISAQAESRTPGNLVVQIPLDAIEKNPYQTRYDFDKEMLQDLAYSIQANGVVQPVVVRPAETEGRYVLILGERRCRASKMAGKSSVPAIVRRVSEQQAAEMTIVENLQRQDLNCMEQAEAFRVLSQQFKLTQQEIGDRVGMSRESVSNYMRLLRLTQPVMEHLLSDRISFTEARELLKLEDPHIIERAAEKVVKEQMKFDQVEAMVMQLRHMVDPVMPGEEKKHIGARWVDPNVRAAQSELERLLQVRVRIRDNRGKGKIVIEYSTVDDYERVVDALRGKK